MDNKFDNIVKVALLDEVKELSNTEDFFEKIEASIKMGTSKRNKDYKNYSAGFGYKRHISIAACLLIVCTVLVFISSPQSRAFASQAVSSIKTVFVLEKVEDKMEVVEKPANELFSYPGDSITVQSDEYISKKLGYKVKYMFFLGNSFNLKDRHLGVELLKQVDTETLLKLNLDMHNAVEDDTALLLLEPYHATRFATGTYQRNCSESFFISTSQAWKLSEFERWMMPYENVEGFEIFKVKIGDLDGYWYKRPVPVYPFKMENGYGKFDMSEKPEISDTYTLLWEKSGVGYMLYTSYYLDFILTLEESLKIAEDFMKAN